MFFGTPLPYVRPGENSARNGTMVSETSSARSLQDENKTNRVAFSAREHGCDPQLSLTNGIQGSCLSQSTFHSFTLFKESAF